MTFLFSKPHPHPARSWPLLLAVMRHTGSLGGLKAYSNEILVPFLPLLFPGFPLAIQPPWEEPWQHQPEANPIPKGDSAGTAAQILSPTCHRNNCCWTVKHWPFTISHLPACCQSSSEESVDHFSSPWHFVLSPEHVLHFQRKDLQGVVAPSCILLPAQAAYSAWENWFFFWLLPLCWLEVSAKQALAQEMQSVHAYLWKQRLSLKFWEETPWNVTTPLSTFSH